ncbi:MAG: cell division protein FtsZ [Ruminococcaceae bacterium]|nr:cell division protein FtsZ [Oscillospiraceae bacterium]
MGVFIDEDGFEMETDNLDESAVYDVKIKVFGVGGGGGNALAYMAKLYAKEAEEMEASGEDVMAGLRDKIEFIAVNTDVAALKGKDKNLMRRIQIGKKTCKGRGAGGRPEVAAEAAKENSDEIKDIIQDASIVFIAAGMGGGTGTGAAPVIAEIAKEMDKITVGVVTKPFEYEREYKMNQAVKGIDEMRKHVDSLLIIPNERLLKTNEKMLSFKQAFAMVDDVLYRSVKIISDMAYKSANSIIGTDFADLCSILSNSGDAHIALGVGTGENKIQDAVSQVVNSPLLETSINSATRLLINVTLSTDSAISDLNDIARMITDMADPSVEMIQGVSQDENLSDTISIAVIATGFKPGAPAIKSTFNNPPAAAQQTAAKPAEQGVILAQGSENDSGDITTSKNSDDLSDIIKNTLGNIQGQERFADLQDIFDNRYKK